MNYKSINREFILATVFFTMAELMIVLGIIGQTFELFGLAAMYAIPIFICYISAREKFKHP